MTVPLPWFPCYPSKLLGALSGMKPDEGYLYWIVCLRIYETGHACRDTIDALVRRSGMNKRRVNIVLESLLASGKLVRQDNGIMNPFASEVMAEANAIRETRKIAGKNGASRRWEKTKEKQSPIDGEANADPMANDGHLHLQEQKEERVSPPNGGLFPDDVGTSDWPKDFREQFWDKYPRKTEKKSAVSKLDAIRKSKKVLWQTILDGIDRYCKKLAAESTEEKFIKHPTTWLNRGCWDDVVTINHPEEGNGSSGKNSWNGHHDGKSRRGFAAYAADQARRASENKGPSG